MSAERQAPRQTLTTLATRPGIRPARALQPDPHDPGPVLPPSPDAVTRLAGPAPRTATRLVFHPGYDVRHWGLQRLHPYDTHKATGAMRAVISGAGETVWKLTTVVPGPAPPELLGLVHPADHLAALLDGTARHAGPAATRDPRIALPVRHVVHGTALAARHALQTGLALNMAGGYHHAKPAKAEGFCLFNDIAIAIASLRADGALAATAPVVVIDLDAHQGNGTAHCVRNDPSVLLFDMYNADAYPRSDTVATERIDQPIGLPRGCGGAEYIARLTRALPGFLDAMAARHGRPALVVFNAGQDVAHDDSLGGLGLDDAAIGVRDGFVLDQVLARRLPTLVLPSGGYARRAATRVAALAFTVLDRGRDLVDAV